MMMINAFSRRLDCTATMMQGMKNHVSDFGYRWSCIDDLVINEIRNPLSRSVVFRAFVSRVGRESPLTEPKG
jgi:hypothetical protein